MCGVWNVWSISNKIIIKIGTKKYTQYSVVSENRLAIFGISISCGAWTWDEMNTHANVVIHAIHSIRQLRMSQTVSRKPRFAVRNKIFCQMNAFAHTYTQGGARWRRVTYYKMLSSSYRSFVNVNCCSLQYIVLHAIGSLLIVVDFCEPEYSKKNKVEMTKARERDVATWWLLLVISSLFYHFHVVLTQNL